jgi:hypothetical protein
MPSDIIEAPTELSSTLVVDYNANPTAEADVASGATTLYQVRVDNTANAGTVYVKISDAASVTVGTTHPDMTFPARGSKVTSFLIQEGHAFTTGLSFWCTSGPLSSSTTGPANDVVVHVNCT